MKTSEQKKKINDYDLYWAVEDTKNPKKKHYNEKLYQIILEKIKKGIY